MYYMCEHNTDIFRKAHVKLFCPYFLFFEKMTGFSYIYIFYTDFGVFMLNEMN